MQKNNKKKMRKGFTLVELVGVVAIIGILAVIAVPKFVNMTESAKVSAFESNVDVLKTAITMYMADNQGTVPVDGIVLAPYVADMAGFSDVCEMLSDKVDNSTYTWDGTEVKAVLTNLKGDYDNRKAGTYGSGTYTITFEP